MKHQLGLPLILPDSTTLYYSFNKNVLTLQTTERVIARIKSLKTLISIEELQLEECRNIQDVELLVKGKASSSIKIL